MEWSDEGIILKARAHGENAVIASILTAQHGMFLGVVHGGQSQRKAPVLQHGNHIMAHWRARLPEQLGYFQMDSIAAFGARWLHEPLTLALMNSACGITEACLAERMPLPLVYQELYLLLRDGNESDWAPRYVKWECSLLTHLGYGLDLRQCALTGEAGNLAYVSPKTGRAVTSAAGAQWRHRLFPLPAFLVDEGDWTYTDILNGLELTGHFLAQHVLADGRKSLASSLPLARQHLAGMLQRMDERQTRMIA